jgi:hypothetical protein
MDVITECERNGARFLEQKSATTTDDEAKDDDVITNKDLVWTVLTKERTFRKVSLAIQYRQRCKALATSVSPTPLKKALQTVTVPKQHNSPNCCTSLNDIPIGSKLLDPSTIQQQTKNQQQQIQPLNYPSAYVSPKDLTPTNGTIMTSTPLYNNIRTRDFELDKSQQYVDMNRTVSNHDFKGYNNNTFQNESLHWMKQQSHTFDTLAKTTASSPWSSLPMLSHEMNSLPLQASYSIPIRQRNINMYSDYSNNNEFSSMPNQNYMMHNHNNHSTLPYINNDAMNNNSCNRNVFTSSTTNEEENRYWYDTSASTSLSSPVQPLHMNSYNNNNTYYCNPTVSPPSHQLPSPQQSLQQQHRRRISSCTTTPIFDANNDRFNCDDVISITEMTVNTMEMKEFHHIVYDTDSDNDHTENDNDSHSHRHDMHTTATTTTNHSCTGTISDILNNDLCMSPISLSTTTTPYDTTMNGTLPTDMLQFPLLSEERHSQQEHSQLHNHYITIN